MKRIILLLIGMLPGVAAFGQAALGLGSSGLSGLSDSVKQGSTVAASIYVKNIGNDNYTGSVFVSYTLGSVHFFFKGKTDVTDLKPGDSVELRFNIPFNDNTSSLGSNIIVVWPTGTTADGKDTIRRNVTVVNSSSLLSFRKPVVERVSIYPNPATHILYFDLIPGVMVQQLFLYDIQGRLQPVHLEDGDKVDVSLLKNGVYYMKARLSNNEETAIRFVKVN